MSVHLAFFIGKDAHLVDLADEPIKILALIAIFDA